MFDFVTSSKCNGIMSLPHIKSFVVLNIHQFPISSVVDTSGYVLYKRCTDTHQGLWMILLFLISL